MTQRSHMLRIEWPPLLLAKLGLAFGGHGLARGAPLSRALRTEPSEINEGCGYLEVGLRSKFP
jgi:hypothetical protein